MVTLTNLNISKSPLQHPFLRSRLVISHFFTSPFPSACHIQFGNRTNRSPRVLWTRWIIQVEDAFVHHVVREQREIKRKKRGESNCWQHNLVTKSVPNKFFSTSWRAGTSLRQSTPFVDNECGHLSWDSGGRKCGNKLFVTQSHRDISW